jgi:endonuclease/exonuclease/phosphatase family metal-dependent hydrolase
VLSTLPLNLVRSHIDEGFTNQFSDGEQRLFRSRDCLEVDVDLPDGETLTLYINHLKSKFSFDDDDLLEGHEKRRAQSRAIYDLVTERFRGQQTTALYAVVGDLNDTPLSPWVEPLVDTSRFTNVIEEYRGPTDHWTYYWRSRNRVSQIDYVLTSRALADRIDAVIQADPTKKPHIERAGLGFRELNANGEVLPETARLVQFQPDNVTNGPLLPEVRVPFRFPRYNEVLDDWHNNVSDHCPVKLWL